MNLIKSFKLFENNSSIDIEKICSFYEDVKSIGYLLYDEGINIEYRLGAVVIPNGSLEKGIYRILIRNCDDIRDAFVRYRSFTFIEFLIKIENYTNRDSSKSNLSLVNKGLSEESFENEFERYLTLLKEHLDYVDDRYISIRGYRPANATKEILISSDFFM
jgi:hypothetical protein